MATDGFWGDGEGVHPMAKKEFLKDILGAKKDGDRTRGQKELH